MAEIPSDIPAYAFIKRELKNQIESGELAEGDRVPSEFELARKYGVSRNPTRQAMRDLELEGFIERAPGRGSFVAPRNKHQMVLKVPSWRTLAIACPDLECLYTRNVIQAFIQTASDRGFQAMVYFLRLSNKDEFEFLADMRNSGIEGMAFWLQHASERTLDLLRRFRRSKFPFVLIDRYVRGIEADAVVTDNDEIAFKLTTALLQRGHHDVAFITADLDNTAVEDRFSGYRRALKEVGLPFDVQIMGVFNAEEGTASKVISRIMAHRRRPSAFFCTNDGVAITVADELAALGYRIPEDCEIAAIDDNLVAEALGVPMLTAAQAAEEMGRVSAELLVARIENPDRAPQHQFLKAKMGEEVPVEVDKPNAKREKGGESEEEPDTRTAVKQ